MNPDTQQLYDELVKELPTSYSSQRDKWAKQIIDNRIDLKLLCELLKYSPKVAMRFTWLLSDVGIVNPEYLKNYLSYLLKLSNEKLAVDLKPQMVKYWFIAGMPAEDEGEAIDLLFKVLYSHEYKLHFKHSAIKCLLRELKKYPELKEELKIAVEMQLETDTTDNFKRWCSKVLANLA